MKARRRAWRYAIQWARSVKLSAGLFQLAAAELGPAGSIVDHRKAP